MTAKFYAFLLFAVVLEGSADVLFRRWGLSGGGSSFMFALAIYVIGGACWGLSLQFREVSRGIIVFAMLNVIVVTVAGVLLFDEKLTFANKLGILAGMGSIVLIES
jgi:multidrug transporter EmrE-like cation transporter